jgi:hypothetical protein
LNTYRDQATFSRQDIPDQDVIDTVLNTLAPDTHLVLIGLSKESLTAVDAVNHSIFITIILHKTTLSVLVSSDTPRPTLKLKPLFNPAPIRVKWVYDSNCNNTTIPIDVTNLPKQSFYPNLPVPLHTYYDNFLKSRSNILLLIGPPGTGKTSFIKGFLAHTQSDALISYDPAILEQDAIFAEFMSGNSRQNVMVLEDADSFLTSRSRTSNAVMHKFLNIGDGLLSTRDKKIIFTTNLPSTRDVDPALLRPGRCYDALSFGKLTPEQARAINPTINPDTDLTLAEILNDAQPTSSIARPLGF